MKKMLHAMLVLNVLAVSSLYSMDKWEASKGAAIGLCGAVGWHGGRDLAVLY